MSLKTASWMSLSAVNCITKLCGFGSDAPMKTCFFLVHNNGTSRHLVFHKTVNDVTTEFNMSFLKL